MSLIRVIDVESSGEAPPEHGLCEIGYCDIVSDDNDLAGSPVNWRVAGGKARLCNPGVPMPPETSAVHHLVDEDVADAPPWKALMASILKQTREDGAIAMAAHSAKFELAWMHPDWNPLPMICTYKVALRLWPDAPLHSNQGLRYHRRPEGLDREESSPAHRAYPDAYVTAHHLRDMLNEGRSIEQMLEWTGQPALTLKCRLGDYRNGGKGTPWEEVDIGFLNWILSKGTFDEDTVFTVKHHLKKREMDQREEAERAELNRQLRENGMEEVGGNPLTDKRQESLI